MGVYTHKGGESDPRPWASTRIKEAKAIPGRSTRIKEAKAIPGRSTYAAHEWEFTRQGYAHGLRGRRAGDATRLSRRRRPPPVVDSVFPRVGQTTPTPNLMKKTYAGRRKEVRPPRISVQ